MIATDPTAERRKLQRFLAHRDGRTLFFIEFDGARHALLDLSLEGFSILADTLPPVGHSFGFVMRLDGINDRIRGTARIVNHVPGPQGMQAGGRFQSFEGEGAYDLHDWLTVHVISSASVRISEKEAKAIVAGPPLI